MPVDALHSILNHLQIKLNYLKAQMTCNPRILTNQYLFLYGCCLLIGHYVKPYYLITKGAYNLMIMYCSLLPIEICLGL